MIRVRRIAGRFRFLRRYVVEYDVPGEGGVTRRAELGRTTAHTLLAGLVGQADAWVFLNKADAVWDSGATSGWAVEFDNEAARRDMAEHLKRQRP